MVGVTADLNVRKQFELVRGQARKVEFTVTGSNDVVSLTCDGLGNPIRLTILSPSRERYPHEHLELDLVEVFHKASEMAADLYETATGCVVIDGVPLADLRKHSRLSGRRLKELGNRTP